MFLVLSLDGQILASIPVATARISDPEYLKGLRLSLEEENSEILDLSEKEPECYIEADSLMNQNTKKYLN